MVRGIKFVGIPVPNQDVSLKFYTEALGLKIVTDQPFTGTHRWIELLIPGVATVLAEIRAFARKLPKHAAPNALVWISYPKKTSKVEGDLSRDVIREAMNGTGWRAVSIVAIDEVWSALRFRPAAHVRSRSKRG